MQAHAPAVPPPHQPANQLQRPNNVMSLWILTYVFVIVVASLVLGAFCFVRVTALGGQLEQMRADTNAKLDALLARVDLTALLAKEQAKQSAAIAQASLHWEMVSWRNDATKRSLREDVAIDAVHDYVAFRQAACEAYERFVPPEPAYGPTTGAPYPALDSKKDAWIPRRPQR